MARYRNEDSVLAMFNRFFHLCETKEQKTLVLDMKQAFLEIIPSDATPKSAWISVDERLPDPGLPILIFTRKNRYYVGYYYKAVVDTTYTGFYADSVKRDVTHWMPMPEPPITDKPTQEQ